ncbi:MAG TPA: sodium-independent anion transporter [Agriterribacter sp.]|nr:sodium-independent anion transporter [Agriterribacter sp.]
MIKFTDVNILTGENTDREEANDAKAVSNYDIPAEVEVFELNGPLFFGAAYKFKDAIRFIKKPPKVLIIRMRYVPIIDATGIRTLREIHKESKNRGTKLILSEVHSKQVLDELRTARLLFAVGKANVTDTFEQALKRSNAVINDGGGKR